MKLYRIIRMHKHKAPTKRGLPTGLPLKEAQAWCKREDTHGQNWFDGYEEE